MANVQINKYENFPTLHLQTFNNLGAVSGDSLRIHGIELEGSLSFNTPAIIVSQGHTAATLTFSLGLYSLSGSTLSLANSASNTFNTNANGLRWMTLVTSVAQNVTPGNWYFAILYTSGGNAAVSIFNNSGGGFSQGGYGGVFVRGYYSATTGAFPASIATSNMTKEGTDSAGLSTVHPYVLISA